MNALDIHNKAERRYAQELDAFGIRWERVRPNRFPFAGTSYTPDFYLPETNSYVEVIGTRSRYSQIKEKLDAFRLHYPHVRLIVERYDVAATTKAAAEPTNAIVRNSGAQMTLYEFASLGGKARAAALTKAQRQKIARKAAKARWDRERVK